MYFSKPNNYFKSTQFNFVHFRLDLNVWINEPLQSSSESDDDNQSDDHSNFFNLGGFDKTAEIDENIPNTAEQVEKVIINYLVYTSPTTK